MRRDTAISHPWCARQPDHPWPGAHSGTRCHRLA